MKLDPERLRTLTTLLRTGSFEAAALEMGITQSAVSQRIKQLEESVGTSLVLRQTPCVSTESGQRLVAHAEQVNALEIILAKDLSHRLGDAPIPISIAVDQNSFASWFCNCLENQTEFLFNLKTEDPAFSDALLQSGQVVGAITQTEQPLSGCDSQFLGTLNSVAVASPDFVKRHFAHGVTAKALCAAPVICFDVKDLTFKRWLQENFKPLLTPPSHRIGTRDGVIKATRAGLGWSMQVSDTIKEDLAKGRLLALKPDTVVSTPLYWQSSRMWRDILQNLTRSICQTARKKLPQS